MQVQLLQTAVVRISLIKLVGGAEKNISVTLVSTH